MKKRTRLLAGFLSAALLFALSWPAASAQTQYDPATLRLTYPGTINMNPGEIGVLQHNSQEGLVRTNPNDVQGDVVKGLADSWTVSADGTTYTFHIRSSAHWSDGMPVTAQDFVYAWNRLKQREDPGFIRSLEIQSMTALVNDSLQVKFPHGGDYLLRVLGSDALVPIRQSNVEAQGSRFGEPNSTLYCGPYVISAFTADYVELYKNPQYWDKDNVRFSRVLLYRQLQPEYSARFFQRGQLDEASIGYTHAPFFPQEETLRVASSKISYLLFNTKTGPLANKHIRKALSLSLDPSIYNSALLGFIPYGISGTSNEFRYEFPVQNRYNLEQARSELKVGLGELGLSALPQITLDTENAQSDQYFTCLWKNALGIDVLVQQQSYQQMTTRLASGEGQITKLLWSPDFNDPSNYLNIFRTNGFYGNRWSNPTFDTLLNEADSTADRQMRMIKLHNAEELLLDEAVVQPLYQLSYSYIVHPNVDLAIIRWNTVHDFKASTKSAPAQRTINVFHDVNQIPTYARTPIEHLLNSEVVGGVGNDLFAPESGVTRAQFVKMLVKGIGFEYAVPGNQQFSDLDRNAWYYPYVLTARAYGLLQGSQDASGRWVMRPNDLVTRAEMAKMLENYFTFNAPSGAPSFTDTGGHWAEDAVRAVRSVGVINGYPDGSFRPNATSSRADASTVIDRALGKLTMPSVYGINR